MKMPYIVVKIFNFEVVYRPLFCLPYCYLVYIIFFMFHIVFLLSLLYYIFMERFNSFLNNFIRFLLVFNICILLTIFGFFVKPAFADSLFLDLPYSGSDLSSNPFIMLDNTVKVGSYYSSHTAYIFAALPYSSASRYNVYLVYDNLISGSGSSYYFSYDGSSSSVQNLSSVSVDSSYNLRYGYFSSNQSLSSLNTDIVPVFSSITEGLASVRDYIDNPPSPSVDYTGLRIPNGYFARFELSGNSGSITLNTTMPIASNIFGTPWPNSSQTWLSTGISSAVSFANSSRLDVVWSKSGKTSVFGTTYEASTTLSGSNQYIWVYNPLQMKPYFVSDTTYYPPNGTLILTDASSVKSVRLFSVTSSIWGPDLDVTDSSYYDASVTSSGAVEWLDLDGDPVIPPDGGGNTPSGDSNSVAQQFRSLLNDLVGRIESLLVAPVEYIQRIINAGSQFFAWLSGLWGWLPSSVSGILTSVLYVMAVVGAVKLLWR